MVLEKEDKSKEGVSSQIVDNDASSSNVCGKLEAIRPNRSEEEFMSQNSEHIVDHPVLKQGHHPEISVYKLKTFSSESYFHNVSGEMESREDEWISRQRQKWMEYQQDIGGDLTEHEDMLNIYQRWRRSRARNQNPAGLLDRASHSVRQTFATLSEKADRRVRQFSRLVRAGVPPELRGKIWWLCSGAQRKKDSAAEDEQYHALVKQAAQMPPRAAQEIEKDLYRTFPNMSAYESEDGISNLRRVLLAYSIRNEEVGYCQSLNFLVAILLLHMDEEESFWVLAAIVEDLAPDYYTHSMLGSHVDQRVFKELISERLPALHNHFESMHLHVDPLSFKWFLCLYVNTLPMDLTLRVWDCFFHEGSKVLFRIGLTLLKIFEKDLLQMKESIQVYELLKIFDRNALGRAAKCMAEYLSVDSSQSTCDMVISIAHEKAWLGTLTTEHILCFQSKIRPHVIKELLGMQRRKEKRRKSSFKSSENGFENGGADHENGKVTSKGQGEEGDDDYEFVDDGWEDNSRSLAASGHATGKGGQHKQTDLEASFMGGMAEMVGDEAGGNSSGEHIHDSGEQIVKPSGAQGHELVEYQPNGRDRLIANEIHIDAPSGSLFVNSSPLVNIQFVSDEKLAELDSLPSLVSLQVHPSPPLGPNLAGSSPQRLADRASPNGSFSGFSLSTGGIGEHSQTPARSLLGPQSPGQGIAMDTRRSAGRIGREGARPALGLTILQGDHAGLRPPTTPLDRVPEGSPTIHAANHPSINHATNDTEKPAPSEHYHDELSDSMCSESSSGLERSGYVDPKFSHRFRSLSAYLDGTKKTQELLIENYYE